jgi:hypothetical protein
VLPPGRGSLGHVSLVIRRLGQRYRQRRALAAAQQVDLDPV